MFSLSRSRSPWRERYLFPVEENLKACVEVGVVVDHCLNKVQTELVVTEKSVVGKELHHSPVRLSGVGGWSMGHDVPFSKSTHTLFPSRTLATWQYVESAFTALRPTPLRPTDF